MSQHDVLEARLMALADGFDYPVQPDLATGVRRTIEERSRPPFSWAPRIAFGLAACLVIGFAGFIALSSSARRAIAEHLGVDGIRITFDDEVPAVLGDDLDLGEPVDLERAQEGVDFDIGIPSALGDPDAIYLNDSAEGGEVSLVYETGPQLPGSEQTGVGAVLTEFIGTPQTDSIKKVVAGRTTVEFVSVDGADGYFIKGFPHVLVYERDGGTRSLLPRLAGNTLLWDGGEVTYRLEAEVGLERALKIARSIGSN